MVHPVKTPLHAARTVASASLSLARHPVRTAGDVVSLGRGLVASAIGGRHSSPSDRIVHSSAPLAEPAPADEAATLKRQGDPVIEASSMESPAPEQPTAEQPAAEQPAEPRETVVTEPSAVTAAGDEEEVPSSAVPYEEEDTEVTTPVGTTGAGPGHNPDTGETDLQQPGTEPLMDPSTTKRIKKESETLRKASERRKG